MARGLLRCGALAGALARRCFGGPATRIVRAAENANRTINVEWRDGTVGRYSLVWLRDCSPDAATYTFSPAMTARNLSMRDFDVRPEIEQLAVADDGLSVHIAWKGGHTSRFESHWLLRRNPIDEQARALRRKVYLFPETTWDRQQIEASVKIFEFSDLINDDKVLHDFLEAVCLDGIARLRGGPGRGAVEQIGKRVLLIHRTHFGTIFEVATKSDASNMAYASNGELPFHTDFPSLCDPPQLQLLHMVSRAELGGNSLFVDGFHIAKLLKAEQPEAYDTLCRHSAEFVEEGYDVHSDATGGDAVFPFKMIARHRTFKLDQDGRLVQVQFGNAMRSWFYDCAPEDVQHIYDALKVFTEYCYDERNLYRFQLQDGETVMWANTRVLHTRDKFANAPGKARVLEGCYFSWDVVKSRVRQLRTALRLPQDQPSA